MTTSYRASHEAFTLWFTGLSGSGKTTISLLLTERLRTHGARVELLDGDCIRTHLSNDLGYTKEDRDKNIERIGFVSMLLNRNGVIVIVAAISPYRSMRQTVRAQLSTFIEIYMRCPVDVLISRDVKGLYRKALAGEIPHFTGISAPYEEPLNPEVVLDTSTETAVQSADRLWKYLSDLGLVASISS